MRALLTATLLSTVATTATAQNCADTSLGTAFAVSGFDEVLPMRPLGFAFPLGGTSYTHVHVSTKGYAFLSNIGVPVVPTSADYTPSAGELAAGGPRIAAFWNDIGPSEHGRVYYRSTPGVFTITWQNAQNYQLDDRRFDVQLQLFATGLVRVFYGDGLRNTSQDPSAVQAVVGISPGNVALTAASVFTANGSATTSLIHQTWPAANTCPLAGSSITFTPNLLGGWLWSRQAAVQCAQQIDYGVGCPQPGYDSIGEAFAANGCDMSNRTIKWIRTSSGYSVERSNTSVFVPPGPAAQVVAGGQLDGVQTFTLPQPLPAPGAPQNAIRVCTKGYIDLTGNTAPVDITPTLTELFNAPETRFCGWYDWDQSSTGGGDILYEVVGDLVYVTWQAVHGYGNATPGTMQFRFDLATGDVWLTFGVFTGLDHPVVVGFSVGGVSIPPPPVDLSTNGFSGVRDVTYVGSPLSLLGVNTPMLGTNVLLQTANAPNLVGLGVLFLGDGPTVPSFDLGAIGMGGCRAYTTGNLGAFTFAITPASGVGFWTLSVPNLASLAGTKLFGQSIAFSNVTPANLISSNGLELRVGF